MPVKGIKRVQMNTRKVLAEIAGPRTERVLTEVMIVGSSHAALLTPIDTTTLINSQYKKLEPMPGGMQGKVGYTAAYAAAVHGMSGKLKGQPREHFGRTRAGKEFGGGTGKGNYWDPDAEPGFLTKGFERDGLNEIKAIIKQGYKV
ncbi:hypothetical protein IAW16_003716 [Salmonella enterica]|nr:hypothetical protein [Salmonella enterica]